MKRSALQIVIIFLCVIMASPLLFSAPIYQNDNQSAEFVRTINRNASTEVDAAYYNPAGLAMMEKSGLLIQLSDQMIFQKQTTESQSGIVSPPVAREKYTGYAHTWGFPSLFLVYKAENATFYYHFSFIGAGAVGDFKHGMPQLNYLAYGVAAQIAAGFGGLTQFDVDSKLYTYAVDIGNTIGASYKFSDVVSAAIGVRHIYALQQSKVKVHYNTAIAGAVDLLTSVPNTFSDTNIEVEAYGHSAGFIGGLDIKPTKELNIGLLYEYYTVMKLKNEKPTKFDVPATVQQAYAAFDQGYETKVTFPAKAAIGISYMILPVLKAEADFSYYFNSYTDWGRDPMTGKKINNTIDDGWGAGLAFEYTVIPGLKASAGGTYSISGKRAESRSFARQGLDCITLGAGASYAYSENLDLTVGLMRVIWFSDRGTSLSANDRVATPYTWDAAIGATYKAL